jgi:hypothetical protein
LYSQAWFQRNDVKFIINKYFFILYIK